MHDCPCCGAPVHKPIENSGGRVVTVPLCDPCGQGDCDPAETWHCDGRNGHHCDGTGCKEIAEATRDDRNYWDDRYSGEG